MNLAAVKQIGPGQRRARSLAVIALLLVLLAASVVLATGMGAVSVPPWQTLLILLNRIPGLHFDVPGQYEIIIWAVRLPRVVCALLVGFALGISGAAMQGFFRNPMASPDIVGVSAGASMGSVLAITLGWTLFSPWLLPASAFLGALLATFVTYALATQRGRTETATLLLAGIAVSSFFSSAISLIYHFIDDGVLRQIVYWLMGNLSGKRWEHVTVLFPVVMAGSVGLWAFSRDLNVMLLSEDEASSLGVNVERTKRWLILFVSLVTGAAVSISGMIGFVGLIVPHILRQLVGPDHRWLLPASGLGGALLLVLADLAARTLFAPIELRPGIVTALIGVPFFLYLLAKRRELVRWN